MPDQTFAVHPGEPYPLGATWDGEGVNFALYSENATRVEVCLFAADGQETRVALREQTAFIWHGYLPGVQPVSYTHLTLPTNREV